MELKESILKRRSFRRFKDEEISDEVLFELVDLAKYAPSWKNSQVARYNFIKDKDIIKEIANNAVLDFVYNKESLLKAPNLLVISYKKNRSGFERDGSPSTSKKGEWQMFDCALAAQTLSLAAYEKGLGTCIMGIFDDKKVKQIINLPDDEEVSCLMMIGYPDEEALAPSRKDTSDLVRIIF